MYCTCTDIPCVRTCMRACMHGCEDSMCDRHVCPHIWQDRKCCVAKTMLPSTVTEGGTRDDNLHTPTFSHQRLAQHVQRAPSAHRARNRASWSSRCGCMHGCRWTTRLQSAKRWTCPSALAICNWRAIWHMESHVWAQGIGSRLGTKAAAKACTTALAQLWFSWQCNFEQTQPHVNPTARPPSRPAIRPTARRPD